MAFGHLFVAYGYWLIAKSKPEGFQGRSLALSMAERVQFWLNVPPAGREGRQMESLGLIFFPKGGGRQK
jgi:hypothetical protein